MPSRSYLYVPADQPDKLRRARTRGADALVVDLEDGVAPTRKVTARQALAQWLQDTGDEPGTSEIWVRIGSAGPGEEPAMPDLAVAVHPAVTGIVQAKCESRRALDLLDEAVSGLEADRGLAVGATSVAVLIETASGYEARAQLAIAPRVARLQLGEADLAVSLGMSPGVDATELLPLRVGLVVTSAAAGLQPPVGPVHTRLSDLHGLRRSSEQLRRLGYAGRSAVHPRQVSVINEVFTPTDAEEAKAARLVRLFDAGVVQGRGTLRSEDGELVDEAVVRAARAVLEKAHAARRRVPRPDNPDPMTGE
jgi:citrate lyase subunit beta/citryl-CoA lyase